jgi:hypothetical protein
MPSPHRLRLRSGEDVNRAQHAFFGLDLAISGGHAN